VWGRISKQTKINLLALWQDSNLKQRGLKSERLN
jgi:hypothetical protein